MRVHVSEKGCTELLCWEHPVSDPCPSNCVERTFGRCACTKKGRGECAQKKKNKIREWDRVEVRQRNSTKNRGALCSCESPQVLSEQLVHMLTVHSLRRSPEPHWPLHFALTHTAQWGCSLCSSGPARFNTLPQLQKNATPTRWSLLFISSCAFGTFTNQEELFKKIWH